MSATYNLSRIKPVTINQNRIFKSYESGKNLYIHGTAGTGKTYIALYLALDSVLNHPEEGFRKVILIRSAVPSRKQGFLPGNETEKNEVFEIPYCIIIEKLFDKSGSYKYLKNNDIFQFLSTSYLRGLTFEEAIIIIEEVQNMSYQEINTVITRTGKNCKVVIVGDSNQNDLVHMHEDSCIEDLNKKISRMPSFDIIEMSVNDICRNDVVKEWILAG